MTEKSLLWTTNNTGDGLSSGYTATEFFSLFRSWCHPTNLGGVFPDILNELAVSGASSPVAVNTGHALVYGIPYLSTASENVTIPTPVTSTRVDRIVLRADWTAQTVRITRIAGTEGAGVPALTQSAGTTWDFPLAQASITTGGVITLTDERAYIGNQADSSITTAMLADNAVTTAKITDANVTLAKMANLAADTIIGRANGAGTGVPTALTATQVRTLINVANGANAYVHPNHTGDVTSVADGATTIANSAVTLAKMANLAADTIIGRANGAGTGVPTALTATQVRTIINVANGADVTSATNVGSSIHGATAKTTLTGADEFAIIDSAASNVLKNITFTNLQAALGSNTWTSFTPSYLVGASATGVTGTFSGRYLTFNKTVFVQISIVLTNKGAGSGNVTIGNLPTASGASMKFGRMDVDYSNANTAMVYMYGKVDATATTITLLKQTAANTQSYSSAFANTDSTNSFQINITGWYEID